ncbi:Disease resistance-like protein DSC1 [Citrus sinensis]|uniref:Disease resistance-like protein DSC1 n=1 Tax=Citrus sinensis TaxID=2711 RepID=A0ACB8MBP2_CITSI|nr:Disease resistance-like protein DSC1 [Citrus sinensis]
MASSSSQRKYEVFLSFRGEDTRKGFTSHLAAALDQKQIQFFIDDEELKKGDEISPALANAIETSDISIIIFSKDYASSKWCLSELVKILDCKKMNGQIVIPVFYHVDPSDVRKQSGSFGEAFVEYEKNFPHKVKKWRDALTEASSLSGYDATESRTEAELVKEIAADISKKLEDMSDSTDLDGFVGLNSRIEEVKSLLCLESRDVRIVGIWGMGGIGKTTIASAVFHQISRHFQGKCFMANVREESNKMEAIHVRDEVISQVLGDKNLKIGTLVIHQNIRKRLRQVKMLIVLDEVHDGFTQLESLAGELDKFTTGSRIIITTRDKQVLDKCGVNYVYEVEGLEHNKALELFYRKAFRQNNCPPGFLGLSLEVVHYARNNPLALEVLGSSLYQKSKQQWEDRLHNLRLISEPNIYKVLKISYDELNSKEKEMFLDIACFFKGEDLDLVTRIQDNPISARHGLNNLVGKSLIKISSWNRANRLQMHDLLQEMGQTIVCQESVKEPGKRSRLWDHIDVSHVLKKNKGTDNIEGIFLNLSKINDLHLSPQAFAKMSNLRLLKFYMPEHDGVPITSSKVHLDQGLEYLPEELRYLHWHEYPLKTLPFDFEPENLTELSLPYSKVEQSWGGKRKAFKLKFIDLSHSQYLIRMPDLSEAPNLERINLLNCTNLVSVPSSIQNFNHLSMLCFEGCKSLRSFPSNLHFVCPVTINCGGCINLTEFPQISGSVTKLILWETAIKEVPSSVGCLTNLKVLGLSQCLRLKRISTSILKLKSLQNLYLIQCFDLENFPEILEKMEYLSYNALGRTKIRELPSTFEKGEGTESQLPSSVADTNDLEGLSLYLRNYALNGCLSSLEYLDLSGNDFESLPASIKQLSRLRKLHLCYCDKLQSIPELPLSLKWLDASNCERLQTFPEISSYLEEVDASVLERLSKHYRRLHDYSRYSPRDSSIEFWFNNCLKLNEKAKNNNNLADTQLRIRHMAIASLRLPYELEVLEPCKLRGSAIIMPGSKIPEWFSNQSSGSEITLQLPHHCCQNLIGFAVSFVLVPHEKMWDGFHIGGTCDFEMNTLSGRKRVRGCLFMNNFNEFTSYSDHVVVGFNVCGVHFGFPDDNHHTTVSFQFNSFVYVVKHCGVCPVYAKPNDTKPNTFTLNFASQISKLDDMASTS